MMAYLVAIEGYTLPAMVKAMKAFLSGKVKRENMTFAPSAPEFSEQVRLEQLTIDAENRPRIEVAPKPEGPRVAEWKLDLLNAALKGDNKARAKLRTMFPQIDIPDAPEPKEAAE